MLVKNTKIRLLLLLICALPLSSCKKVNVTDKTICTVAGRLLAGVDCATTLTQQKWGLTFEQTVELLEPQDERPDPSNPKKKLPARAGAAIMPFSDLVQWKTEMQQACTLLKSACSYELKQVIDKASDMIDKLEATHKAKKENEQ